MMRRACWKRWRRKRRKPALSFLYGNILFLMPSAMKQFMPFLEREFPHLVKRYRKLYARSAYLRGEYPEKIAHLLAELRDALRLGWQSRGSARRGAPSADGSSV